MRDSITADGRPAESRRDRLEEILFERGFTGDIESTLPARLHHTINPALADLGRLLWFDKAGGLHDDNTCGGCHSPSHGFGDTQSIAIGVQNNNLVGPNRTGPRNQAHADGDELGVLPEADVEWPVLRAVGRPVRQLAGARLSAFDAFDDGLGGVVPPPDESGFRNEPIRQAVLARLDGSAAYRQLFGQLFPSVAAGGPIDFKMFGLAVAEFEFTLTFANAPIDRLARGDRRTTTSAIGRGVTPSTRGRRTRAGSGAGGGGRSRAGRG